MVCHPVEAFTKGRKQFRELIIIVLYYHKIQTFLHLDSFGTVGLGGWSLKLIFLLNVQLQLLQLQQMKTLFGLF